MCSKLFRELLNNKLVFVPSEFIKPFLAYCAVYMSCHPCGGAFEPGGQWLYLDK